MTTSRWVNKTCCNKRQGRESDDESTSSIRTSNKRQRIGDNGSTSSTPIKSLPTDLLINVIARVLSESCTDIVNIKACCKDFYHASKQKNMWQQISLQKFQSIDQSFLLNCKKAGNLEGLYRVGLREYFGSENGKIDGLKDIKMAADKGLPEAKYVYGMILLCSDDDDLRKEGVEYMRFLRKAKCVISCREKFGTLIWRIVWEPKGILVNQTPLCRFKNTCNGWWPNNSWKFLYEDNEDHDDDRLLNCENCRWDYELHFFYRILNLLK